MARDSSPRIASTIFTSDCLSLPAPIKPMTQFELLQKPQINSSSFLLWWLRVALISFWTPFCELKPILHLPLFRKLSFPEGQNCENENPFAKWNKYLQDPQDEYNWCHMLGTPKPSPENPLLSASTVSMCISNPKCCESKEIGRLLFPLGVILNYIIFQKFCDRRRRRRWTLITRIVNKAWLRLECKFASVVCVVRLAAPSSMNLLMSFQVSTSFHIKPST